MRSDYWGQGGHNAILVVGDFFRSVLQRRLINVKASFPPSRRPPLPPSPDAEPLPVEPWSRSIETIVRGDPAGVDALKRDPSPPKSAEELERVMRGMGRDPQTSVPRDEPPWRDNGAAARLPLPPPPPPTLPPPPDVTQ